MVLESLPGWNPCNEKDAVLKDLVRLIYTCIYIFIVEKFHARDGCALVTRIANARSFAETKPVAKAFWRKCTSCMHFLSWTGNFLGECFLKVEALMVPGKIKEDRFNGTLGSFEYFLTYSDRKRKKKEKKRILYIIVLVFENNLRWEGEGYRSNYNKMIVQVFRG